MIPMDACISSLLTGVHFLLCLFGSAVTCWSWYLFVSATIMSHISSVNIWLKTTPSLISAPFGYLWVGPGAGSANDLSTGGLCVTDYSNAGFVAVGHALLFHGLFFHYLYFELGYDHEPFLDLWSKSWNFILLNLSIYSDQAEKHRKTMPWQK